MKREPRALVPIEGSSKKRGIDYPWRVEKRDSQCPRSSERNLKGWVWKHWQYPLAPSLPRSPCSDMSGGQGIKLKGSHKIPEVFIFLRPHWSKTSSLNTATETRGLTLTTWTHLTNVWSLPPSTDMQRGGWKRGRVLSSKFVSMGTTPVKNQANIKHFFCSSSFCYSRYSEKTLHEWTFSCLSLTSFKGSTSHIFKKK